MNRTATEGVTMNLTTASPAEVDSVLFPILERIAAKESHLANYRWLLGEVGRKPSSFARRNVRDGLEYNDPGVQRSSFEDGKRGIEADLGRLNAEARPMEDEFTRRGGWTRYLVVPGGKLHKRECHTLTPGRTMVGQVAEASGLDEGPVIAKYDVVACTHCFPNAPVEEKKTPAEEGFCAHSGEYVKGDDWRRRYVRCECGEHVAVTSTGKLRKHKAAV